MKKLRIDFVSDVACPWCVIGLKSLEQAIANAADAITAELHLQPFELNPGMPAAGQDMGEHLTEKYGTTPSQSAANREMITARAAEVGFDMQMKGGSRVYNTFDAHRLLHWAALEGRPLELKHALFTTYFTRNDNTADIDILVAAATHAGLDPDAARHILTSGLYADDVRKDVALWQSRGVTSVPSIIIDSTYIISGGQPVAAFEQALRSIAAETV